MTPALRLGTFDAERAWRPAHLARLPEVAEASAARARIERMDEVLAGACAPGDTLVTRRAMDEELLTVMADAGLRFTNHAVADGDGEGVAELLADDPAAAGLLRDHRLVPYAVTGPVTRLCDLAPRSPNPLPAVADVARVNSKTWSNALAHDLGLGGTGVSVFSTGELARAVAETGFPAVVKDPYGVSGHGALTVPSPGVLRAITRVLDRQVGAGKHMELLVQPLLAKRHDLSAHGELARDGTWRWIGLCSVHNRGFRFTGAGPPDAAVAPLEPAMREVTHEVARRAFAAGYWGPLSVDAMVLADHTLVPVLEVNARISLGRLTLDMDRTCGDEAGGPNRCHLWQVELISGAAPVTTGLLLHALRRDGLLAGGCVPLGGVVAAPVIRWHCVLRCAPGDVERLRDRVLATLASLGLRETGATHGAFGRVARRCV